MRLCFFSIVVVAVVAHQNEVSVDVIKYGTKSKNIALVENVRVPDISAEIQIATSAVVRRLEHEVLDVDHGESVSRQRIGLATADYDAEGEFPTALSSRVNWVWENAGVAVSRPILFLVNPLDDRPRFYKLCETCRRSTVVDELIFEIGGACDRAGHAEAQPRLQNFNTEKWPFQLGQRTFGYSCTSVISSPQHNCRNDKQTIESNKKPVSDFIRTVFYLNAALIGSIARRLVAQ